MLEIMSYLKMLIFISFCQLISNPPQAEPLNMGLDKSVNHQVSKYFLESKFNTQEDQRLIEDLLPIDIKTRRLHGKNLAL